MFQYTYFEEHLLTGASQLGKSMTLDDIITPLDEEGDPPVVANSETAAVLESLEDLFSELTW